MSRWGTLTGEAPSMPSDVRSGVRSRAKRAQGSAGARPAGRAAAAGLVPGGQRGWRGRAQARKGRGSPPGGGGERLEGPTAGPQDGAAGRGPLDDLEAVLALDDRLRAHEG